MKVNNITATDYRSTESGGLVLVLTNTDMETILAMDTSVLTVETDEGTFVEAFAGMQIVSLTYDVTDKSWLVNLVPAIEDTTKKALEELSREVADLKAQSGESGPVLAAASAFALVATNIPDEQALAMTGLFPMWEQLLAAGEKIEYGRILQEGEQLYRVVQEAGVVPQEHQPPSAEGMLAVYRPIDEAHAGTLEDPIPWVYGMDCYAGKYYLYNEKTYLVAEGGNMIPCTWPPDTAGMWQWVLQE